MRPGGKRRYLIPAQIEGAHLKVNYIVLFFFFLFSCSLNDGYWIDFSKFSKVSWSEWWGVSVSFIILLVKYISCENLAIRETEKPAIIVKNKPSNVDFGEECVELFVGGIMGHFFLNISVPRLCGYLSVSVYFENSDLLSSWLKAFRYLCPNWSMLQVGLKFRPLYK